MFLKLHQSGVSIFVNMSKVYDFHADELGTMLHFDVSVAPYGSYGEYDIKKKRDLRHWSIVVDEASDVIFRALAGRG